MELLSYVANVTARWLALAAPGLAVVWIFRVKSAAARHAALTVAVGAMLPLAALTALLPGMPLRVLPEERMATTAPAPEVWVESPVPAPVRQPPLQAPPRARRGPWPGFAWAQLPAALYCGVALVLLLRLAYGYWFARKLVRGSRKLEPAPPGAAEGVQSIYESDWISVPMTVGWLRPKILLPARWRKWEPARLEAVLAHERTHVARADWGVSAMAAVTRCLFWFNPLAWWMERKLAYLAEQACDDAALLITGARETYAEALLDMAAAVRGGQGRMVWEAMAMAQTAEVRKRIERILDDTRRIPRGFTRARWAALVACTLPLLYVSAAARLAPARSSRGPSPMDFMAAAAPQPQSAPVEAAQGGSVSGIPHTAAGQAAGPAQEGQARTAQSAEGLYAGRRLLALYFDLQGMSAADVARAQSGAQTFLDTQLTSSDLVAVMTGAETVKVVQDFTGDRNLLSQAVRGIAASGDDAGAMSGIISSGGCPANGAVVTAGRRLAALESAIRKLGALPDKKALVYFGGGMTCDGDGTDAQLRATIGAAREANVAIYPVSAGALAPAAQFQAEVAETVIRASAQAPYPYRLMMTPVTRLHAVDPVYPDRAAAEALQGNVQLDVVIGVDGHVQSAVAISGPPIFVPAARTAALQTVYKPVTTPDGEPAEVETAVMVTFQLRGLRATYFTPFEAQFSAAARLPKYSQGIATLLDHPVRVESKVNPEYPYPERARGHQGTVTVEADIGVDGVPADARITRSDPAFDRAVLAAVKQWRFTPAVKDGQAVESTVTLPFRFSLE